MEYIPQVVQAVPADEHQVYAYFSDGSIRLADIKPLIAKGGVFAPLADEVTFRDSITVLNHAVAWDLSGTRDATRCIDIDPIVMYETARIVDEPLELFAVA